MQVEVDKIKCIGCGDCLTICPAGAIKLKEEKAEISESCVFCAACIYDCAEKALLLVK